MIQRLKKLLKSNKVLSLFGNLAASGFSFISFFLLARLLSTDDLGIWIVFLTVAGFFDMFRAGLIRVALIRNIFIDEKKVIGSSWLMALVISIVQITICMILKFIFPKFVSDSHLDLFVNYFPLLTLINLPYYFTFWIQQAKSRFDFILISRILQSLPFAVFLGVAIFSFEINLEWIVIGYLASFLISSCIGLILNWTNVSYLFHANKKTVKELYNFGKYSIGTVIGTNLLKSSDTLIINWMLGPAAVSFYSVPYKVLEIIEIPVRSIVATILPKMAKASATGESKSKIANLFKENVGTLTILVIPVLILCFVFAEQLVVLIGGEDYREAGNILRIFTVYGLLLPTDRFIGITLDAINKPQFNLRKIIFMVSANIVFDVIVLYYFQEVWAAATVTILTISIGILAGKKFINQQIPINFSEILPQGWKSLKKSKKSF